MIIKVKSNFDILDINDTRIVLADLDDGCSVTNDADNVISWLEHNLDGGIKKRKVYYRDSTGRFDELVVINGAFSGFKACTDGQQESLKRGIS